MHALQPIDRCAPTALPGRRMRAILQSQLIKITVSHCVVRFQAHGDKQNIQSCAEKNPEHGTVILCPADWVWLGL